MADLVRWDPFWGSLSLRDALDRFFEEPPLRPFCRWPWSEGKIQPLALDVCETDEEEKQEKGAYHYCELCAQSFQRTITLPAEVDADAAKAVFRNGMLKLTLPKVEAVKPKRIAVKIE